MALSLRLSLTSLTRRPALSLSSLRVSAPYSVAVATTSKRAVAATSATTTEKKQKGIMAPRPVSPELQEFLGSVAEISRTQVLKAVWAYIKQHELQDPDDKKIIVCDEKLKKIFSGKDRVGFLEVSKLIGQHFPKKS
ncbi:TRI1-like protein [Drosera capensis]